MRYSFVYFPLSFTDASGFAKTDFALLTLIMLCRFEAKLR
uniref:Uncharacterized protein n=1 Tax=Candidatus Kentrum sp. LFY TaxID=2126342 RepID=A0A450X4F3_9GAMM|nr:MAG: hypothetical protein BECKLFY1418C_GA0070996_11682 [Candidatus Kentron sp. LFY]VFK24155.1 MAG: hypothetical protein BECKLFY1418C_GA0070996_11692 [Candidatus Kentron sp. LFY]